MFGPGIFLRVPRSASALLVAIRFARVSPETFSVGFVGRKLLGLDGLVVDSRKVFARELTYDFLPGLFLSSSVFSEESRALWMAVRKPFHVMTPGARRNAQQRRVWSWRVCTHAHRGAVSARPDPGCPVDPSESTRRPDSIASAGWRESMRREPRRVLSFRASGDTLTRARGASHVARRVVHATSSD